jgi:hypothetical protein
VQVLLCQYKLQEALAVQQQLLVDVFEAQQAWRASCMSSHAGNNLHTAEASTSADAGDEQAAESAAAGDCSGDLEPAAASPAAASVGKREQQQQQQQVLQLAVRLAAALSGLTADVLLAAVQNAGAEAAVAAHTADGPVPRKLPCIFPTPLHWSKWLKSDSEQVGVARIKLALPSLTHAVISAFILQAAFHDCLQH